MTSFTPKNVRVPIGLNTQNFKLRMLTVNDLVKDFEAVMTSVDRLKGIFGPESTWPEGVSMEQDLIDLGWHQKEFQLKRSFAFTVMTPDESKCLGCVYIEPSEKQAYEAKVILWVRQSEATSGLDDELFTAVKRWIVDEWWFTKVAYPGREITWNNWVMLEDDK